MSSIRADAVVHCANESLLLEAAMQHAARRGTTPQAYLDVRRAAGATVAFDIETIVASALRDAYCTLVSWSATSTTARPEERCRPSAPGMIVAVDALER